MSAAAIEYCPTCGVTFADAYDYDEHTCLNAEMVVRSLHEAECCEGVDRRGEYEVCGKPAVALRIDPEEGAPYAVCKRHTRTQMVPLTGIIDALKSAGLK